MKTETDSTANQKRPTALDSMRLLAAGETLKSRAHGGSAVIVEILPDGIVLKHPSGAVRLNKWSALAMWKRVQNHPKRYGEMSAILQATRKQANAEVSDRRRQKP